MVSHVLSSPQNVESLWLLSRKSVCPNALHSFYSFTNEHSLKNGSHSTGFQTLVLPSYVQLVFLSDIKPSTWWSIHLWGAQLQCESAVFHSTSVTAVQVGGFGIKTYRVLKSVLEYYGVSLRIIVLQLYYTSTTVTDRYCNQLLRVK